MILPEYLAKLKPYLPGIVAFVMILISGLGLLVLNFRQSAEVVETIELPTTSTPLLPTTQTTLIPQLIDTNLSLTPTLLPIPASKFLPNDYHVFQSFNNCGPAALSMALSYYGINQSQQVLGLDLRPYQHPTGDNDDKSVTLEELAAKGAEYGLIAYHRPAGDMELIKQFIANDIPVVTRTLLNSDEDIGHYRVVKGYDESTGELIQDDSLQGKNLRYTYQSFNQLWKQFNFEYLVLVPSDKQAVALAILGDQADPAKAWQKAASLSQQALAVDQSDVYARFNLSVAQYQLDEYQRSVEEFEQVQSLLPFRTLWYQIEPIQAYYQLGNDERVLGITSEILNNHNRAFSELYIIRGDVYTRQGRADLALEEYQKAVQYNENLDLAREKLGGI